MNPNKLRADDDCETSKTKLSSDLTGAPNPLPVDPKMHSLQRLNSIHQPQAFSPYDIVAPTLTLHSPPPTHPTTSTKNNQNPHNAISLNTHHQATVKVDPNPLISSLPSQMDHPPQHLHPQPTATSPTLPLPTDQDNQTPLSITPLQLQNIPNLTHFLKTGTSGPPKPQGPNKLSHAQTSHLTTTTNHPSPPNTIPSLLNISSPSHPTTQFTRKQTKKCALRIQLYLDIIDSGHSMPGIETERSFNTNYLIDKIKNEAGNEEEGGSLKVEVGDIPGVGGRGDGDGDDEDEDGGYGNEALDFDFDFNFNFDLKGIGSWTTNDL